MRYEALGIIEAQYFTVAAEILDAVCKGGNVELLSSEKYLGGRLVTLVLGGGVSDIQASLEIARQVCEGKPNEPLKMALAITNPHEEILRYIVPANEGNSIGETLLPPDAAEIKITNHSENEEEL
ncbi:BMC domain-containing protein [Mesobacillus zeae]